MEPIIKAQGVSKQYRIGALRDPYSTVRDSLARAVRAPLERLRGRGSGASDTIWALNDVSFEVGAGEVVGLIGRNGSGKSTLLKVLSRITEPTRGRVELYGRVGSLLEVGTGFHGELSGRENIYLNGAILGMQKSEIESKLDEIIAFAEIEKFIDTPVKRYSSGMYMRLAFAVAAHLEPEILLVDEVLAVGDAAFQKKCLGKMGDIAKEGRTVIFVSHNMSAVQRLCTRGILLDQGRIAKNCSITEAIHFYLRSGLEQQGERIWAGVDAPGFDDGSVRLQSIRVVDRFGNIKVDFDVKEPVTVEVEYRVLRMQHVLNVHLYFRDESGETIFVSMDSADSPWRERPAPAGLYRARCEVPANLLNEGTMRVEYLICTRPTSTLYVTYPDAISFNMTDDMEEAGARGNWIREWPASIIRPRLNWAVEHVPSTEMEDERVPAARS
jgi:lipopolysaccharide transport system ATP-binding protein